MFIAFNFEDLDKFKATLKNSTYKKIYIDKGQEIFEKDRTEIKDTIQKFYLDTNKVLLNGQEIMKEWFPLVESDVFICHSHSDIKEVYEFVGFLKVEFGIKAFIDSAAWGYADELLKMIDENHCRNEYSNNYDYKKRNITTSNVYLMLLNSLQNMIDNTECIIFLQTPNSVKTIPQQFTDGTYSPWIFSELNIVEKIRRKVPMREYDFKIGSTLKHKLKKSEVLLDSFQVIYNVDEQISSLEKLNYLDLINWKNDKDENLVAKNNLDKLYRLKRLLENY